MNKETLSKRIKFARSEAGLSQSQVAEKVGFSRGRVSSWETGESKPDEESIKILASITNFPVSFFVKTDPIKALEFANKEAAIKVESLLNQKDNYSNACTDIGSQIFRISILYLAVIALSFFTIPYGFIFASAGVFLVPNLSLVRQTKAMKAAQIIIQVLRPIR